MALLKDVLQEIEKLNIDENMIYHELLKVNDPNNIFETKAEKLAFSIFDSNTIIGEEQGFSEYEAERILNQDSLTEFIKYIYKRSKLTKNPILKTRYCKLYIEFISKVKELKFDNTMVEDLIISTKSIAQLNNNLFKLHTVMYYLSYAISISIRFNKKRLTEELKNFIISFCERIDLLEKQGVWYTIYIVLLNKKDKTKLSKSDVEKIMQFLQKVLELEKYPYEIIRISDLISSYYNSQNENDLVKNTLDKAYNRLNTFGSSAISLINLMLSFQSVVKKYDYKDLEVKITKRIEKNGDNVINEMNLENIPFPENIQEQFTKWQRSEIENLRKLLANNSFDKILISILWNYVPRKAEVQNERNKNASLIERLPGVVAEVNVDKDGIPVTTSSGLENENSLLIKWLINRTFPITNNFFSFTIFTLFKEYSKSEESIASIINGSIFFSNRHKDITIKATKAFFEENYLVAIHLLVPQIEDIIRVILFINGGEIRRPNQYGGYDKILLHTILENNILLSALGEDLILYLKAILTHRLGYNVRNKLCHGLLESFSSVIALRLLHIVILLALIKIIESDE